MVPYVGSILLPNSSRVKFTLLLNKFQVTEICLCGLKEELESSLHIQTREDYEAASLQLPLYLWLESAPLMFSDPFLGNYNG